VVLLRDPLLTLGPHRPYLDEQPFEPLPELPGSVRIGRPGRLADLVERAIVDAYDRGYRDRAEGH
jgi:hypothetical protein